MWTSLSLQTRLSVLFCTMLIITFAILLAVLIGFSAQQLQDEREPAERIVAQIANAFNAELASNPTEREVLTRLLRRFNDLPAGNLRYRDEAGSGALSRPPALQVPAWFVQLLGVETRPTEVPIDELSGRLLLYSTDGADLFEKWIFFLFIAVAPIVLGSLAFVIAGLTVRATLRPMHSLAAGITRLRDGDYNRPVALEGSPEIRRACEEINALGGVLTTLRASNYALMKRLVSAQDDERAEIGRDLHDEFGPLLFAARAHAHALLAHGGDETVAELATEISRIVEAIQKTNSRLLARLRPLDLENLGLTRNIAALIDSPAARAGNLAADIKLDPAIDRLDELSARTVYRFVQEAITNILRHARASKAGVLATIQGSQVTAEVSDNGIGMVEGTMGRGLQGMKERIDALGGTFLVASTSAGTVVRCTLPIA